MAAIVRLFFINKITWSDATYTFVDLGVWLNVECNIGIVSACLPIFPPLFNHIHPLLKKFRHSVFSSRASVASQRRLTSAGSEQADVEGERHGAQERKDERVKRVTEGSEMSRSELRTPKASSITGVGRHDEAQSVHLPD